MFNFLLKKTKRKKINMAKTVKFVLTLILFFFLFLISAKEVDINPNLIRTFIVCEADSDCPSPNLFEVMVIYYRCVDRRCELYVRDPLPPIFFEKKNTQTLCKEE
jgi:hypothetical protein